MRRVTIIGLGWLGMPLAEQLQQQGWQVKGSKRTATDSAIACYPFELSQSTNESLHPLFPCEALVITLPPSSVGLEAYIEGVKRLVSYAVSQNVAHILFTSSSAVLPKQNGDFDEESVLEPNNLLGQLEQWLLAQRCHIDVLRLAGLAGRQRHPIYYLAGRKNLEQPDQPVNLLHLDDCITAICTLLDNPNGQRLYHLCAPEHPTRQAYYGEIARRLSLAPLHFSDDSAPLARKVVADKICREQHFSYRYPDPYRFPELI